MVKILLVDDINLNIYDYQEHDFNKPTAKEISRAKSYSEKLGRLQDHSLLGEGCKDKSSYSGAVETADYSEIESQVIDDICKDSNIEQPEFCSPSIK